MIGELQKRRIRLFVDGLLEELLLQTGCPWRAWRILRLPRSHLLCLSLPVVETRSARSLRRMFDDVSWGRLDLHTRSTVLGECRLVISQEAQKSFLVVLPDKSSSSRMDAQNLFQRHLML